MAGDSKEYTKGEQRTRPAAFYLGGFEIVLLDGLARGLSNRRSGARQPLLEREKKRDGINPYRGRGVTRI